MDTAKETLEKQISLLLVWEKRKRREATLVVALFYAILAALAVPLFLPLLPAWAALAALFALIAPSLLFTQRWRDEDTARALAALDRKLRLDERATTAWELVRRNETKAVALLVLQQASEKLERFEPRTLFPRAWGWHAWLLLPLFALWLALFHFEARFDVHRAARPSPSLARELHELARELQQKAQDEGLPRTLEVARELEKIARRGIDEATAEEALKRELAGFGKKLAAEKRAPDGAAADTPASRRELADLRAEIEAARESFAAGDSEAQALQERLAGLSQLKKQMALQQDGAREMSRGELKALVEKLEKEVTGELDRRALAEAEESLKALTQRGQARDGKPRPGLSDERDKLAEDKRDNTPGSNPGDAPGEKGGKPSLPKLQSTWGAPLKGAVGEGERSATFFKAKPAPGKSRLSQDEVIAAYQRQAEAELATERIPEPLKDTIKSYFLSLEKTK